jgi:hypothetical protein
LKKVWEKIDSKILKAENRKIVQDKEHDRKEEPNRAPVVPNKRGPYNFITAAPHWSVASLASLDLAPFANSEGSWSLPENFPCAFIGSKNAI